jgi:hypothetical protein
MAMAIPALTQHYPMLQGNRLYIAVTRASKLAVIVGSPRGRVVDRYTWPGRRPGGSLIRSLGVGYLSPKQEELCPVNSSTTASPSSSS